MSRYLKHLFPVSIYHSCVENNSTIKDMLMSLIEKNGNKGHIPPEGWLTNHLQTSFDDEDFNTHLMDTDTDIGKEINRQYNPILTSFFDRQFECEVTDMWYNLYQNGEYQESHCHFGDWKKQNHFACIHFVSFNPKIHSPLRLWDPVRNIRISSWEYYDTRNYSDHVEVRPQEGDFLMIPAYLEHEVPPGKPTPDYPRITISFNIRIIEMEEDEDE